MKKLYIVFLIAFSSCKPSSEEGGENPDTKVERGKIEAHDFKPRDDISNTSDNMREPFKGVKKKEMHELIEELQVHRDKLAVDAADRVMARIIEKFDPVGKKYRDIADLIGEPDESLKDKIVYSFDTGYGGWAWSFFLEEGKIIEVLRTGID